MIGQEHLATVVPGGYAIVGAAAFTAGITGTVSIAVMIFELTSQLNYMLPVLLSVLVGRAIAFYISRSNIYDTLRSREIPRWPDLSIRQSSYGLLAKDLMQRLLKDDRVTVHDDVRHVQHVLDVNPTWTCFPLVHFDRQYVGTVTRDELEAVVDDARFNPRITRIDVFQFQHANLQLDESTHASRLILLFSVHKTHQLFVTAKGKLCGIVHSADVLAQQHQGVL